MIFKIQKTAGAGGRLGSICGLSRLPDVNFDTPTFMLYTKGAAVPHLTDETLSMVSRVPHILEIPLQNTDQMESGVLKQGFGIAEFSSMTKHMSYMMFVDPLAENKTGHFVKDQVPLWSKTGKKMINGERYMDIVEAYKPDMYHALCDGSFDKDAAKKRNIKAVDRTSALFEVCLLRHVKSEYLSKNSSLLGVISGSHIKEVRERSLSILLASANEIHGFVLEGLTDGGPKTETKPFSDIEEVLNDITPQLPQDKLRVIHGCWNPVVILETIFRGWDVFDSSYPSLCADLGRALTFSFHKQEAKSFEINLTSDIYKDDFSPILDTCECLCCQNHTRAYLNHLINTKEMAAQVLLMIHNLHHYIKFFAEIRRCIRDGELRQLIDTVSEQYDSRDINLSVSEDTLAAKRRKND